MNAFFFGMGYSSLASARALHSLLDGRVSVAGTTRTQERMAELADSSYRIHLFDGERPGGTLDEDLVCATHLVASIPPEERGDPVLHHHRASLDAAKQLQWIVYYSNVSVYGDFDGAWIDEGAGTAPTIEQSRHRVHAENAWRQYAGSRGLPLLILRLAGIYGPGRSAFDKLRSGRSQRIVKPGLVFNRIHVDDIARITAIAAERKLEGTFNVSDDEPAPPQDLVCHAAGLLNLPPPPEVCFEAAEMTEMARSFYYDNKRVSNAAIKKALEIELLHPTYRQGLKSILHQLI